MIPCGIALSRSQAQATWSCAAAPMTHLPVRADHDVHPELAGEPRPTDGPLERRALADVDADDVGRSGAPDLLHVGRGVDGFVGDQRERPTRAPRAARRGRRQHRLLDEGDLALGQARNVRARRAATSRRWRRLRSARRRRRARAQAEPGRRPSRGSRPTFTLNDRKPSPTAVSYPARRSSPSPLREIFTGTSFRNGPPRREATDSPRTRPSASQSAVLTPAL